MELQKTANFNKIGFTLLFATIFALLFTLNIFTPTWGDDWWRALAYQDALDVFPRLHDEYMSWTGRLSVLFFTFLLLLKYPGSLTVFAVINSAVFCLLLLISFRAATGRRAQANLADGLTLFSIFLTTWFFTQSFGEAILWKTGAIAYLWVITFSILALIPFIDLVVDNRVKQNTPIRLIFMPIAVLVLAISLENVAVAMSCFMLFSLFIYWIFHSRPPLWYWLTLAGQLVGSFILLAAPGNYIRFQRQSDGTPIFERFEKLLSVIWQHGLDETHIFYLFAVLLLLVAVTKIKVNLMRPWLWTLFAMLLAFAMAGSTGVNFQDRTAFVAEIAFIVAITALLAPLCQQLARDIKLYLPATLVLLLFFVMNFTIVFEQHLATHQQGERRAELFKAYEAESIQQILVPSMQIPQVHGLKDDIIDGSYFLRDLHGDTPGNGWRNSTFAKYYGFDFANRVSKPYIIYLPELISNKKWNILIANNQMIVAHRLEALGYTKEQALYLLTTNQQCPRNAQIKLGSETVGAQSSVEVINQLGAASNLSCALRFALPQSATTAQLKLPKQSPITINLQQTVKLEALPHFLQSTQIAWKACKLPRNEGVRVDEKSCQIELAPGQSPRLLTYGPYFPVKKGHYSATISYQSWGEAGEWDQVIQSTNGAQFITRATLPNSHGELRSETVQFMADKNDGKLEIRSYANGQGRFKLHSVSLIAK